MIPWAKLNTAPVTRSHSPHSISEARVRSVRTARRVNHRPAASSTRAAGISHEICPPMSVRNSRSHPVGPQMLARPVPPNPPTLPDSWPEIRPKPL